MIMAESFCHLIYFDHLPFSSCLLRYIRPTKDGMGWEPTPFQSILHTVWWLLDLHQKDPKGSLDGMKEIRDFD